MWREWYNALEKPSWTPPPQAIGLIWNILYPIIFLSLGYVIYKAYKGEISWLVALPFILNIILNITFTPVQFWLRDLFFASIIILGVLVTIVWSMVSIWPHSKLIAVLQLPYLIWVSIATTLQLTITFKNPNA